MRTYLLIAALVCTIVATIVVNDVHLTIWDLARPYLGSGEVHVLATEKTDTTDQKPHISTTTQTTDPSLDSTPAQSTAGPPNKSTPSALPTSVHNSAIPRAFERAIPTPPTHFPPSPAAPKIEPQFRLIGITRGAHWQAVLEHKNTQQVIMFSVGDTIPEWGVLVTIAKHHIQIETVSGEISTIPYVGMLSPDVPASPEPDPINSSTQMMPMQSPQPNIPSSQPVSQ